MATYLDLVKANDSFPYDHKDYYVLRIGDDPHDHGFITPPVLEQLRSVLGEAFHIDEGSYIVHVARQDSTPTGTAESLYYQTAFQECIDAMIANRLFPSINIHSELFPILGAKVPISIERFAASLFGIIHRGAHLTVYTQTPDGMRILVPRRSPNVFTYPNKLDTTVAGGVTAGETPLQNVVREAWEEASLSEKFVRKNIKACGCLTYMQQSTGETGDAAGVICPDAVYVFDLEVDATVELKPNDDEVKEFYSMTVDEVKKQLLAGEFKTNSAVVMIDFFIRHGIITQDNEPDYVEIISLMHRRLPFPMRSIEGI